LIDSSLVKIAKNSGFSDWLNSGDADYFIKALDACGGRVNVIVHPGYLADTVEALTRGGNKDIADEYVRYQKQVVEAVSGSNIPTIFIVNRFSELPCLKTNSGLLLVPSRDDDIPYPIPEAELLFRRVLENVKHAVLGGERCIMDSSGKPVNGCVWYALSMLRDQGIEAEVDSRLTFNEIESKTEIADKPAGITFKEIDDKLDNYEMRIRGMQEKYVPEDNEEVPVAVNLPNDDVLLKPQETEGLHEDIPLLKEKPVWSILEGCGLSSPSPVIAAKRMAKNKLKQARIFGQKEELGLLVGPMARKKIVAEAISEDLEALIRKAEAAKQSIEKNLRSAWDDEKNLKEGSRVLGAVITKLSGKIPDEWRFASGEAMLKEFGEYKSYYISESRLEQIDALENMGLNQKAGNYRTFDRNDGTEIIDVYTSAISVLGSGKSYISSSSDYAEESLVMQGYCKRHEYTEGLDRRLTNYFGAKNDVGQRPKKGSIFQYRSRIRGFSEAFPIIYGLMDLSVRTGMPVKELIPLVYLQPVFGLDPVDAKDVAEAYAALDLIEALEMKGYSAVEVLSSFTNERFEITLDSFRAFGSEKLVSEAREKFKAFVALHGLEKIRSDDSLYCEELVLRAVHTVSVSTDRSSGVVKASVELLKYIFGVYDDKSLIMASLGLYEDIVPG
jgi:hypothetical protein